MPGQPVKGQLMHAVCSGFGHLPRNQEVGRKMVWGEEQTKVQGGGGGMKQEQQQKRGSSESLRRLLGSSEHNGG